MEDSKAVEDISVAKNPRFPLSKVKKIAKCDKDYIITSNAAIVATAFAAELFVQSLAEDGLSMGMLQSERKAGGTAKNKSKQVRLTLDDLIETVQRKQEYYFLEDTINKKNFPKPNVVNGAKNGTDKSKSSDSSKIERDKSSRIKKGNSSTITKDSSNKIHQSLLRFANTATLNNTPSLPPPKDDEDVMEVDTDEGEEILDGVEEEEEEDEDNDQDEENQEEEGQVNYLETLEEDDLSSNDDDISSDSEDMAKQRLVGRAETVEEVHSDTEFSD